MSVRSEKPVSANELANNMAIARIDDVAASADAPLAEGNSFSTANPENPLKRNLVVSIKASLNDFCLSRTKGTWAPSQEALRNICAPPHAP